MSSAPPSPPRAGATRIRGPRRARRSEAADTRTRILDAAEKLFIEMGYAATSVRAIARRACVNLAAAHYHFGSKEGLLGATVHRRVAPVNAARARALDVLQRAVPAPSVEQILEVFFAPLVESGVDAALPRLIARLYGEPKSVSTSLIEREFGATARRFLDALGGALPGLDADLLAWRFHFMIGSMIHLLAYDHPLNMDPPKTGADGLRQLLPFAVAGIQHGVSRRTAAPGTRR